MENLKVVVCGDGTRASQGPNPEDLSEFTTLPVTLHVMKGANYLHNITATLQQHNTSSFLYNVACMAKL